MAVARGEQGYGLAVVDASTGEFLATEVPDWNTLHNEFWRYDPVECLVTEGDEAVLDEVSRIAGENPPQCGYSR